MTLSKTVSLIESHLLILMIQNLDEKGLNDSFFLLPLFCLPQSFHVLFVMGFQEFSPTV